MIRLTRQRTTAIPARYRGADRIGHEEALLTARRDQLAAGEGSLGFLKSSMWKPAKARLEAETAGKCGYCEAFARNVAHCDVEHIRPKSIYWWLGLCFDNYVLSCQICNQAPNKLDQYPVTRLLAEPAIRADTPAARIAALANTIAPDPLNDDAQLTFAEFERQLRRENPDLIHPYAEDPEPFFVWNVDSVLREVSIAPRAARGRAKARAASTIQILGLNRPELLRNRHTTYQPVDTLCQGVRAAIPAALRATFEQSLREAMADNHPYAAMNRYVIRVIHGLTI
jgi:hypothetical protein